MSFVLPHRPSNRELARPVRRRLVLAPFAASCLVAVVGCGGITNHMYDGAASGAVCPEGRFSATGDPATCVAKTDCRPGRFVSAEGSDLEDRTCVACPSGSFSSGSNQTACRTWSSCAEGTYVAEQPSESRDRTCLSCPAGTTTSGPDRSTCTALGECEAGTVQVSNGSGLPECNRCAAGSYCAGRAAAVVTCGGATWDADGDAATRCVAKSTCVAGQYVASDGSATRDRVCAGCPDGTMSSGTNAPQCVPRTDCQPGQYVLGAGSSGADRLCGGCAAGTFTATKNAASCAAWGTCRPGTYVTNMPSATEDRTCAPCASGTTTSGINQSSCIGPGTCPAGTVLSPGTGAPGTDECNACAAGTYCTGAAAPAVPCSAGTWDHDRDPATVCAPKLTCGPGQYVSSDGSATQDRMCADCAAGTFSADANATTCDVWTECTPGQFVVAAGSRATDRRCAACAPGTLSTVANAPACVPVADCEPGTYVVADGTACAPCAGGTFSSLPNATLCLPWRQCGVGDRMVTEGQADRDRVCEIVCRNGGTYVGPIEPAACQCLPGTWGDACEITTTEVAAGVNLSCARRSDGQVLCWGTNGAGQADVPTGAPFVTVTAAGWHACALKAQADVDGNNIVCWGDNFDGESTPLPGSYTAVSAGLVYGCGIRAGVVACWGTTAAQWATDPSAVPLPSGLAAVTISAGGYHACALAADRSATCWGFNWNGQVSDVPTGTTFDAISAGGVHTCGIKSLDRTVACWGNDDYQQATVPTSLSAVPFLALSAGTEHTCGIKATDRALVCWGRADDDRLQAPAGEFVALAAGATHNCAVRSDGTLVCWGSNAFGEITIP